MSLPLSDHFNGKTFFNANHENRSWRDVLRWQLTSQRTRWPAQVALEPFPPAPSPSETQFAITWIGHATFLIRTAQGNFLTDPNFSERCGPFGLFGPKRVQPPALSIDELPAIHFILLSHDHYDHCDLPSLRRLAKSHDPVVITPLANGPLIRRAGLHRIVELDWWDTHAIEPQLNVTLTPARHWSNRLSGHRNMRLWGGFFVRHGQRSWWFTGDTGYEANQFQEIPRRLGPPDLSMIPIGAYEPRWFMAAQHCNPAEAVKIHCESGSRLSLAMHWGTWPLTDEGREEPVRALEHARKEAGISADAFRVLGAGESIVV